MNSKKYLSALLLTLTLASSQVNALGNVVDRTLDVPANVVGRATYTAKKPVDTVFGTEEIVVEDQYPQSAEDTLFMEKDMNDASDIAEEYSFNKYDYTDQDNIDSDYNAELE